MKKKYNKYLNEREAELFKVSINVYIIQRCEYVLNSSDNTCSCSYLGNTLYISLFTVQNQKFL